ncbi:hypothetical protein N9137_01025 [Pseudomonadales bacterium]|nr:hypothetical protein [Pseudomonadales bacterium]
MACIEDYESMCPPTPVYIVGSCETTVEPQTVTDCDGEPVSVAQIVGIGGVVDVRLCDGNDYKTIVLCDAETGSPVIGVVSVDSTTGVPVVLFYNPDGTLFEGEVISCPIPSDVEYQAVCADGVTLTRGDIWVDNKPTEVSFYLDALGVVVPTPATTPTIGDCGCEVQWEIAHYWNSDTCEKMEYEYGIDCDGNIVYPNGASEPVFYNCGDITACIGGAGGMPTPNPRFTFTDNFSETQVSKIAVNTTTLPIGIWVTGLTNNTLGNKISDIYNGIAPYDNLAGDEIFFARVNVTNANNTPNTNETGYLVFRAGDISENVAQVAMILQYGSGAAGYYSDCGKAIDSDFMTANPVGGEVLPVGYVTGGQSGSLSLSEWPFASAAISAPIDGSSVWVYRCSLDAVGDCEPIDPQPTNVQCEPCCEPVIVSVEPKYDVIESGGIEGTFFHDKGTWLGGTGDPTGSLSFANDLSYYPFTVYAYEMQSQAQVVLASPVTIISPDEYAQFMIDVGFIDTDGQIVTAANWIMPSDATLAIDSIFPNSNSGYPPVFTLSSFSMDCIGIQEIKEIDCEGNEVYRFVIEDGNGNLIPYNLQGTLSNTCEKPVIKTVEQSTCYTVTCNAQVSTNAFTTAPDNPDDLTGVIVELEFIGGIVITIVDDPVTVYTWRDYFEGGRLESLLSQSDYTYEYSYAYNPDNGEDTQIDVRIALCADNLENVGIQFAGGDNTATGNVDTISTSAIGTLVTCIENGEVVEQTLLNELGQVVSDYTITKCPDECAPVIISVERAFDVYEDFNGKQCVPIEKYKSLNCDGTISYEYRTSDPETWLEELYSLVGVESDKCNELPIVRCETCVSARVSTGRGGIQTHSSYVYGTVTGTDWTEFTTNLEAAGYTWELGGDLIIVDGGTLTICGDPLELELTYLSGRVVVTLVLDYVSPESVQVQLDDCSIDKIESAVTNVLEDFTEECADGAVIRWTTATLIVIGTQYALLDSAGTVLASITIDGTQTPLQMYQSLFSSVSATVSIYAQSRIETTYEASCVPNGTVIRFTSTIGEESNIAYNVIELCGDVGKSIRVHLDDCTIEEIKPEPIKFPLVGLEICLLGDDGYNYNAYAWHSADTFPPTLQGYTLSDGTPITGTPVDCGCDFHDVVVTPPIQSFPTENDARGALPTGVVQRTPCDPSTSAWYTFASDVTYTTGWQALIISPIGGAETVSVDWGDGSALDVSGNATDAHEYTSAGTYTITVIRNSPGNPPPTGCDGETVDTTVITIA